MCFHGSNSRPFCKACNLVQQCTLLNRSVWKDVCCQFMHFCVIRKSFVLLGFVTKLGSFGVSFDLVIDPRHIYKVSADE